MNPDTGVIADRGADGYLFICDRAKDVLISRATTCIAASSRRLLEAADVATVVVGRDAAGVGQEPVALLVAGKARVHTVAEAACGRV